MDINDYVDKAAGLGFSKAVWLDSLALECTAEMRAYCDDCPNHGQNWVCPPNCGTLDECRAKAQRFNSGLLLQSITQLDPPVAPERYWQLNREHNLRLRQLVDQLKPNAQAQLALTSGGCVFCDECAYPEPCIKSQDKMESLSAFGVDVGKLCSQAELPFSFSPDIVYFTALLLVEA